MSERWWIKSVMTFWSDVSKGQYAVIKHNIKENYLYIEYYNYKEELFHTEDVYRDKSLRYVEDAAENWALGIKKLQLN